MSDDFYHRYMRILIRYNRPKWSIYFSQWEERITKKEPADSEQCKALASILKGGSK